MIIYFSATGNCKYVAEKIADITGDTVLSMEERKLKITLKEGENLGFVFPTYFWELPVLVREYMDAVLISGTGDHYVFTISTYGTTPGSSGAEAKHILKRKGILVNAMYSLKMPDTWTPMFDLSNKTVVAEKNRNADVLLDCIIDQVKAKLQGKMMQLNTPYYFRYISNLLYNGARSTKKLSVQDNCIGCGLCAKNCPVKAIEMQEGRPAWVKDKCNMCLRCLHKCPKFAIQYQNKTQNHGQYRHEDYKYEKNV